MEAITASEPDLEVKIDGISADKFAELVKDAEANYPISKLLNTKITVEYTLN